MISVYFCSTRTRTYRGQAEQLEISKYRDVSNSLTTVAKDFMIGEFDMERIRIRKLTPKECWRLMGFAKRMPDGSFDDTAFTKASAFNSNSSLYKQAGNSIVVDVLEGIFRELL